MSNQAPFGPASDAAGRDSPNPAPNVFAASSGAGPHHALPPPQGAVSAFSKLGSGVNWTEVADSLPFGLAVLGPDQELRYENSICRVLAGYAIEEKGGIEDWLSALSPGPEHRGRVIESWREFVWRNQVPSLFSLKRLSQKVFDLEIRASLLDDGGLLLVMEDVTERLREEERHRYSHLRFRALFALSENGAALVEPMGRIVDANPALAAMTGIEAKALKRYDFIDLLHPDDALALSRRLEGFGEPSSDAGIDSGTGAPANTADRFEIAPVAMEVRLARHLAKGGREDRHLRLSWTPVSIAGKTAPMGLCLFENVAAAERSEFAKHLQQVSTKVRSLLQSIPDLILLVESDLTVADLIPPPQPWAALTADESWIGKKLAESAPRLSDLVLGFHEKILADRQVVHGELEGLSEDESRFSVSASSAGDGQVFIVVRQLVDAVPPIAAGGIGDLAFGHFPEPLLVVDPGTDILAANDAALRFFGCEAEALVGTLLGKRFRPSKKKGRSESHHFGVIETAANGAIPVELETFSVPSDKDDPDFGVLIRPHDANADRPEAVAGAGTQPPEEPKPVVEHREERGESLAEAETAPKPEAEAEQRPGPERSDGDGEATGMDGERAQHRFRNRIQLVTSLFGFEPQGVAARDAFIRWQIRLRSLASAEGVSEKGVPPSDLAARIAEEVCSLLRQGPVSRVAEIAGGESCRVASEQAPAFALLLGELFRLALLTPQPGRGPALSLRFEEAKSGRLRLLVRPGDGRRFFFSDRESEIEIFEALAEQLGGSAEIPERPATQEWAFDLPL